MRKYLVIWIGEVFSTVGSALTSFALGIWIYEKTGSVSMLTYNMLAMVVPNLLFTPFAGVIADRWNRKWVMVAGDAGVALTTFAVFLLVAGGHLKVGYIFLLTAAASTLGSLQWPAYAAAIPLIVPKQHLGRASALSQVGEGLAELLSPLIAGGLYVMHGVGLKGILFIDFGTFIFSTITLLIVPIPHHRLAAEPEKRKTSALQELRLGWRYIVLRPGLMGLLAYFAMLNFLEEFAYPLAQPLLLETTSPTGAGRSMTIMAVGLFVGIAIMGIWGGPKRRVRGILLLGVWSGLLFALAGLRPSLLLITLAGSGYFALLPIIEGCDEVLWQTKVSPEIQGRVFALQEAISSSIRPAALLLAGPLADRVFEPAMSEHGLLAGSMGQVIGVGPGRGIALFIIILGLLSAGISLGTYLYPRVRRLEEEVPDAPILVEA